MKNGKGVVTFVNGDKYEGIWIDDKSQGPGKYITGHIGILTHSNGDKYEGMISQGQKNGKGIMQYVNGESYDGDWKNNKQDGKGKEE